VVVRLVHTRLDSSYLIAHALVEQIMGGRQGAGDGVPERRLVFAQDHDPQVWLNLQPLVVVVAPDLQQRSHHIQMPILRTGHEAADSIVQVSISSLRPPVSSSALTTSCCPFCALMMPATLRLGCSGAASEMQNHADQRYMEIGFRLGHAGLHVLLPWEQPYHDARRHGAHGD